MNRGFKILIVSLCLMVGVIECGENNNKVSDSAKFPNLLTNLVCTGWVVKSVYQREICGSLSDLVCTAIPSIVYDTEKPKSIVSLSSLLATVNVGRILYDLLKINQRIQGRPELKPELKDASIQTDDLPISSFSDFPPLATRLPEFQPLTTILSDFVFVQHFR